MTYRQTHTQTGPGLDWYIKTRCRKWNVCLFLPLELNCNLEENFLKKTQIYSLFLKKVYTCDQTMYSKSKETRWEVGGAPHSLFVCHHFLEFNNETRLNLDQLSGNCGASPTFHLDPLNFEYSPWQKCILSYGWGCTKIGIKDTIVLSLFFLGRFFFFKFFWYYIIFEQIWKYFPVRDIVSIVGGKNWSEAQNIKNGKSQLRWTKILA